MHSSAGFDVLARRNNPAGARSVTLPFFTTLVQGGNLLVSKQNLGGMATSKVEIIHGEDRVSEIARMLGDAEAPEARKHAHAMLGRSSTLRR